VGQSKLPPPLFSKEGVIIPLFYKEGQEELLVTIQVPTFLIIILAILLFQILSIRITPPPPSLAKRG
jgi:hypothetical protein